MNMETLKSYLPGVVRYVIMAVMGALTARGLMSPESGSVISQNIDPLVTALVLLLTIAYDIVKRPSTKAMEVAKEVDEKIPTKAEVVIKTPGNEPDIIVPGKK